MAKRAQENNRPKILVMGALVLVAVIWRLVSPAAQRPAGPIGEFPAWSSAKVFGDIGSQSVNPAGGIWAGAWNDVDKGKKYSTVWIMDFEKYSAQKCMLPEGPGVSSVTWADDNTIRVVRPQADEPLTYINAADGKIDRSSKLNTDINNVIYWPAKSDKFVAELAGEGKGSRMAVLSGSGDVLGKEVAFELPKGGEFYTDAGLSPDGKQFIFSVLDDAAGDGRAYYFADAQAGTVKHAFDLKDIPGRVDGMWISPEGALVLCSDREKFQALLYDPAAGKLTALPNGAGADMAQKWPDVPKSLSYATFTGGYELDPVTAKVKQLFSFESPKQGDTFWREGLQGGHLYPLKNGNYIAVGVSGRLVDIREISRDGKHLRDLLPRQ